MKAVFKARFPLETFVQNPHLHKNTGQTVTFCAKPGGP